MFQHILVPLDGSSLAEAALPAAAFLAERPGSKVTLAHIIERDAPTQVHGERHLARPEDAAAYLAQTAQGAFPAGATVECHVHTAATADVGRSIVEHQREVSPDLIVMCTHGRSGLRHLLFGSIAQQVIAAGRIPVLLIRPRPDGASAPFSCSAILAPMDAEPAHAAGVHVAGNLAHALGARLHLLSVVPTRGTLTGQHAAEGRYLPGTMHAMLELAEEEARTRLQRRADKARARGISVTGEVRRGDPATAIAEAAAASGADMIAFATHGTCGLDVFLSDSVGAKVLRQTSLPLLLAPVHRKDQEKD